MAKKNLAKDIAAYNKKVSGGQEQEATTKYNTSTQQTKGSNYKSGSGTKTVYASSGLTAKSSSSNGQRRSNQEYRRKKDKEEEEEQKTKQQTKYSGEANTKQPEQKNYLAEAATATNGKRRTNNEYQKQKELKNRTSFTEEANKIGGGAKPEELPKREMTQEFAPRPQQQTAEEDDLDFERWANKPRENRDELLKQYNQAVENERNIAGYATDPMSAAAADEARKTREDLEARLKALNAAEGKSAYTDLADETKARDIVEGFQGEREGQLGAGLGIYADWLGEKTGWEGLEKWGEGARESGRTAYNEAQADWANGMEGASWLAQTAAGVGKSAANVAEDMAVNFLTMGLGGKALMGLRAAGSGALTQEQREKNDTDSVAAKAMLDMGAALLSNKLLGGFEAAYGKSVANGRFPELLKFIKNPQLRKALGNTEGFQEGTEYGISYIGDRLLGLDGEARNPMIIENGIPKPNPDFWKDWGWGEFAQNVIIGYFLGTIFNGIQGGQEYDAERIRAVADEAIEAGMSGLTFDELKDIAMDTTKEDVVIKPGKHEAESVARMKAGAETENVNDQTTRDIAQIAPEAEIAPITESPQGIDQGVENPVELSTEELNLLNRAMQTQNPALWIETHGTTKMIQNLRAYLDQHPDMDVSPRSGAGSNDFPATRQFISDMEGMQTESSIGNDQEVAEIINEWNEQQGAVTETPTEPNADTVKRVQNILADADAEQRGLAPSEINQILNDPAALKAYADETGTTVRQARTDLENRLNGVPDETGSIAQNEQYQNADNAWDRFWGAAQQGPDALIRLIASDPNNMTEYMKYYEQATGEQMSNDPDVLRRQLTDIANDAGSSGFNENPGNNNGNPEQNIPGGQNNEQNNGNQNPFFDNENPQQNNGPVNNDTSASGTGREKTSQFFTRTLTNREGPDVRSPLTYLTKTEAETLQNALNRLSLNGEAEMATMMASSMWSDEQVKMGKVIGQNLLNEARQTGNYQSYDAWRKVEREHATAIARALRAYGRDPDAALDAEGIAKMAANYFSMLRDGVIDDVDVDPETIDSVQKTVTEATNVLGEIEAEEARLRDQGYSDEQVTEITKDRYLDVAQEVITKQFGGFLMDDILGNNANVREGVQDATTILRSLLAQESPEYIRNYAYAVVGGIPTDIRYMGRATAKQRAQQVSSIQKLCQLFGTGTTGRNLLGNSTFGVFNFAANNTGGVIADSVLSLFTGQRSRGMEKGILSGQNWGNALQAARRSALEIAANLDMREDGKYINGTSAFSKYDIGGRFLAKTNQILNYALNTTDAFFVGMGESSASEAAQRANNSRGGSMTEETAQKIGENEALYSTFKNTTQVQKVLESVRNFLDLVGWGGEVTHFQGTDLPSGRKGGFGLGTAIVPYIGVPVNLGLKIAEGSPLGVAKGVYDAVGAVKAAKNAGGNVQAQQDALVLQNKASGEIGRGLFGTAVVIALKALMKQAKDEGKEWYKDWNLEKNSDIKAQNKAEGKSGQQVNRSMLQRILNGEPAGNWETGDDLVNLSSVEPLNQTLALASLLADDEHSSGVDAYLKALGTATVDSLADLPAIASLTQLSDTINYNKEYDTTYEEDAEGNLVENREVNWRKTVGNGLLSMAGTAASGFVPAPARHIAQVQDEYQRDTRGDNAAQTAWNQVVNATPTVKIGDKTIIKGRQGLPVKTDAFGNPVSAGDRETRTKNAFGPLKHTQLNQGEASQEINRIYDETGKSHMPASSGPKTITFGSGDKKRTVELTADERRDYQASRGKAFERSVWDMLGDRVYKKVDSGVQETIMAKHDEYTKANAKEQVAKDNNIEYKNQFAGIKELDDPTKYLTVNTAFNAEKAKDGFDVIDLLIPEIGKMSKDDQEYLRDKNSSAMMYYDYMNPNAYGYKVDSSKSVGYLKEQEKENAKKRGADQASGQDTFKAIKEGYTSKKLSDADVMAMMTKQASNGNYDVTKGRAAVFLAAVAGGKSIEAALELAEAADIDKDGTVDEKAVYIPGEYEGTKVLKKAGINKAGQKAYDEIMYPNGRGKRNKKNGW